MIKKAYAAAGIPMLLVVRGDRETARQILLYSVGLVAFTVAVGLWLGPVYTAGADPRGGPRRACGAAAPRPLDGRAQPRVPLLAYLALLFAAAAVDPLIT